MEMDSGLYQVSKPVFQTSSFRVTVHEELLIRSSNALDLQDPHILAFNSEEKVNVSNQNLLFQATKFTSAMSKPTLATRTASTTA